MLPLVLAIDPASTSGLVLVEPLAEPVDGRVARLLWRRVVPNTRTVSEWSDRAFEAMAALAHLVRDRHPDRRLVVRAELVPPARTNWLAGVTIAERRGMLVQAAADAGLDVSDYDRMLITDWARACGVPWKKEGDGRHRLAEAAARCILPPGLFVGLDGAVDVAEAILIGVAEARMQLGQVERPNPIGKRKKAEKPRRRAKGAA